MSASEIFVRDAARGGSVLYSHHSMRFSSAAAPWRDLMRLERCSKALEHTEIGLLWPGITLARSEGELQYRFGGHPLRSTRMQPDDMFVYPQTALIYVSMPFPVELTCIQVAPAVLAAVGDEVGRPARLRCDGPVRASDVTLMAALLEAEVQSDCANGRLYGEHLAYALAAQLIQRYGADTRQAQAQGPRSGKLAAVLDYIHAHGSEELSLEELARVARLSPFHFSRLFKTGTGLAPHQYVLQCRVEEAKRLLRHSQLEIADIAYRLGFRDQSHFTARFRKIAGATPRQWRQGA